jgi:flagellar motility protein MotE (MotC chaperone)
MRMTNVIRNERGSAWAWIFTIIFLVIVGVGAFLGLIKLGMVEAPEALANLPGMEMILPQEEEAPEETTPEFSETEKLRQDYIILNSRYEAAETQIGSLNQQLADLERLVQEREDEIAQLEDILNLSQEQNINNVGLIFEAMDPEDASTILSNLGADRAALILSAMRESKAADVLAIMDETLATQITQIMAGFEGEGASIISTPTSSETETETGTGTRQPAAGSPRVPTPE